MVDTILERPMLVAVMGSLVTLGLGWLWLQTNYKSVAFTAAVALVLTVVGVTLGYSVETTREQITAWLYQTADELQSNQFESIQRKIHPGASPELRTLEARAEGIEFQQASIKKIHDIEISGKAPERKVVVKMNVFVEMKIAGYDQKIPRYVELVIYEVNNQWLVSDARHEEPTYGFRTQNE